MVTGEAATGYRPYRPGLNKLVPYMALGLYMVYMHSLPHMGHFPRNN